LIPILGIPVLGHLELADTAGTEAEHLMHQIVLGAGTILLTTTT
jgi:hypothetical protein